MIVLITDELEQLRGAHPGRQIELEIVGDTRGFWDGLRVQQLRVTDVRYMYVRLNLSVFAIGKLLKRMAREGIEPPTPAFFRLCL